MDNVTRVKFKIEDRPIAVQLTIHVNNLILTYGSKSIIPEFKSILYNPELLNESGSLMVKQIINHYGVGTCQKWFKDIYGWGFEKVG